MEELRFQLIKLVKKSILQIFIKIKVGNITTDPILIKSGSSQGYAMSPILFNVVIEKVMRKPNITPHERVKFQGLFIDLLAYADDLVIVKESQVRLRSFYADLKNQL